MFIASAALDSRAFRNCSSVIALDSKCPSFKNSKKKRSHETQKPENEQLYSFKVQIKMEIVKIFLLFTLFLVVLFNIIEAKKPPIKNSKSSKAAIDQEDTKSFQSTDKLNKYIKDLNSKNTPQDDEELSPQRIKELEVEEKRLKVSAALVAEEHSHKSRQYATALHRLGKNLHTQKKFDELATIAKKIVGIHEALDGPEHLQTAQALGNYGATAFHIGLMEEVEFAMKRALYIFIQHYGDTSKEVRN